MHQPKQRQHHRESDGNDAQRWDGARDAFGRPLAGWVKFGLPAETGAPAGRTYTDVKQKKP